MLIYYHGNRYYMNPAWDGDNNGGHIRLFNAVESREQADREDAFVDVVPTLDKTVS